MLVTGAMAAREVSVSSATIRKWVQLGRLAPAGRQGRALLYRLEDVFAAERSVHRGGAVVGTAADTAAGSEHRALGPDERVSRG
ncbi:hypothetical protein F0L17_10310 [Streptomyces sp. TRM43335]|uniref:HTH merR-type domain-containing protein n=1 Tax=Streptomyces taklimakanensis TaxID=2569853 RepID=A0A6G2BB60_9ACTN|nr:hypothetical protein [Streptomyces taklimakanensis]MTE19511.1 hypothetical protein [Streptomyces taklimakanensis]